jgi:hypothetical protein
MKARYTLSPNSNLKSKENKTKCFVCKNSMFKVSRITSSLIMLKCTNCGEIHMIATQKTDKLVFWDADQQS